jgi:hypothetical protein
MTEQQLSRDLQREGRGGMNTSERSWNRKKAEGAYRDTER